MDSWHTMTAEETVRRLGTDPSGGLSSEESARRLSLHGLNALVEKGAKSPWRILGEQLTSVMVVILIAAAVVSAFLGDMKDTAAILAIVVLNTLLGFREEFRAEKAMSALERMAIPPVRVCRDSRVAEIPATQLVPGDILLLAEGNLVPADCRVLESASLRVQEAALTGESEPVEKFPDRLEEEDLPLGDRHNMAFRGTVVTYGRGIAAVTLTGMNTELGAIARMIQTVNREPTPLQRRLAELGRTLAVLALVLVALVLLLGLLRGESLTLLFLTAVSMAVAAVPEGLPAVVTIALALGSQRMLGRRALIRKLPAVETLGTVSVICSDKTGTLTGNRMAVDVIEVAGHRIELGEGTPEAVSGNPSAALLLIGAALCSDAAFEPGGEGEGSPRSTGDPTEAALVLAAARFGMRKDELERFLPRVAEAPFDTARRRMTTVHRCVEAVPPLPGGYPYIAFTKGAVDGILDISPFHWVDGKAVTMDASQRERIVSANDGMARSGRRVLAISFRPLQDFPADRGRKADPEKDLIFIGLAGMIDPARPGVKEAVQTCREAGIRPVMITGDHPLTAQTIAGSLGMAGRGGVLTGRDVAGMTPGELESRVEEVSVFARVSPEHKLSIVSALQKRGHVVAMTGDGVNDAPALKKADIGVAMGQAGTDVAREASDMILLDDNFATIVAAVEEGRVLYDNIRKFLSYILLSNLGEVLVMLLAPLLGMPLPLLPLQILWINLVTDGLPALALTVEPAERNTMRRPPLPPTEHIFGQGIGRRILSGGLLMGIISLAVGYAYWRGGDPKWQTMIFCTLTFTQLGNVLAIRSRTDSLFRVGVMSNRSLLLAVALTVGAQLLVVYLPPLQAVFRTVHLPWKELVACLAASMAVFWWMELDKWLLRRATVLPG